MGALPAQGKCLPIISTTLVAAEISFSLVIRLVYAGVASFPLLFPLQYREMNP